MVRAADGTADTRRTARIVAAAAVGVTLLAVESTTPFGTAALLLATPATQRDSGLGGLLLWLVSGAVIGGGAGWGLARVTAPGATLFGLGLGLAVGGGFGTVLKLLRTGEEVSEGESTTMDFGDQDVAPASPQPADLFDSHPDPVLYFDDTGDGPLVRAVNDAFEETFGVGTDAVDGAALNDALMVVDRLDDVVDAATDADQFAGVLDCETRDGTSQFYVRIAARSGDVGTRGYVLYSPVRPDESG